MITRVGASVPAAALGLHGLDAMRTAATRAPQGLVRPLALTFTVLLAASCASAPARTLAGERGEGVAPREIARGDAGTGWAGSALDVSVLESRGLLPLEELARTVIARRLSVTPDRVTVDFDAPRAAHLLLPVASARADSGVAFRLESAGRRGEWLVVFDSVAGTRPELRLPLRAQVMTGRRMPSPQPRR